MSIASSALLFGHSATVALRPGASYEAATTVPIHVRFWGKADIDRPFRRIGSPVGGACYFFVVIVIRYETTAAARWASLLIVRTLFNDAITVAVWTGFHVCVPPCGHFRETTRQGPQFSSMLASLIMGSHDCCRAN